MLLITGDRAQRIYLIGPHKYSMVLRTAEVFLALNLTIILSASIIQYDANPLSY